MANIFSNLKYLRKKKGLTQQQFADALEIKRSLVGAYEEERAEPKYELLKRFSTFLRFFRGVDFQDSLLYIQVNFLEFIVLFFD